MWKAAALSGEEVTSNSSVFASSRSNAKSLWADSSIRILAPKKMRFDGFIGRESHFFIIELCFKLLGVGDLAHGFHKVLLHDIVPLIANGEHT